MEKHVKLSVFLSLLLRHKPEAIGLTLDEQGYLEVDKLIENINKTGRTINKDILDEIVCSDNKKRYEYNTNKSKIRATQGHSIKVDLELIESVPKLCLYHGTADRFVESINKHGLIKGTRQYVHLSEDINTAIDVGKRHGQPIVYKVDTENMLKDDYVFWQARNGVWLSENIPAKYLSIEICEVNK